MDSPGLGWLADREWPECLVFARGVPEDQVLRAFGADPDEAVLRQPGEPVPASAGMTEDAGMEPERIVELAGGITIVFIDGLLRGAFPTVRISDARNLLLIRT
jgi:hypothetical protein